MRGPDVHVTGFDPEPATDQWSCDCGQHARKSKACISVRVSSRPPRNLGQVIMITRKEKERWSMGVGWWVHVPSIDLNKNGAPCWDAVIPIAGDGTLIGQCLHSFTAIYLPISIPPLVGAWGLDIPAQIYITPH